HEPCEHGCIQTWIFLAVHPTEYGAVAGLVHVLMTDVDFGRALTYALEPCTETFAFAAIEDLVNHRAQCRAQPAFRNLGPVFSPIGLDQTSTRVFRANGKALFIPEFQQLGIDLLDRTVHNQPA